MFPDNHWNSVHAFLPPWTLWSDNFKGIHLGIIRMMLLHGGYLSLKSACKNHKSKFAYMHTIDVVGGFAKIFARKSFKLIIMIKWQRTYLLLTHVTWHPFLCKDFLTACSKFLISNKPNIHLYLWWWCTV